MAVWATLQGKWSQIDVSIVGNDMLRLRLTSCRLMMYVYYHDSFIMPVFLAVKQPSVIQRPIILSAWGPSLADVRF